MQCQRPSASRRPQHPSEHMVQRLTFAALHWRSTIRRRSCWQRTHVLVAALRPVKSSVTVCKPQQADVTPSGRRNALRAFTSGAPSSSRERFSDGSSAILLTLRTKDARFARAVATRGGRAEGLAQLASRLHTVRG